MRKLKYDLTNKVFGRLKAMLFSEIREKGKFRLWKCVCECGTICYIRSGDLRNGNKKSCGCRKDNRGLPIDENYNVKQGFLESLGVKTSTKGIKSKNNYEYHCWFSMLSRCYNPDQVGHEYYKNTNVCQEWFCFETFLKDMGKTNRGMTLDRINSDKGYSADNCRWATQSQQMQNRKRRIYLNSGSKYKGVSKTPKGKYRVSLGDKYIKTFESETEAALFYNKIAKDKYGEFAYINKITDFGGDDE